MFQNLLNFLGQSSASVADQLAQNGCGSPADLRQALDSPTEQNLSPIRERALQIARKNPQLAQQIASMLGVPNPFARYSARR